MEQKPIVVAIDGYSSCGKSTLARTLAKKLNYLYIDSGAMYRAVTLFLQEQNMDLGDLHTIQQVLPQIHIHFEHKDGQIQTFLNNRDVSADIRSLEVSNLVSEVSSILSIREMLVNMQRAMANVQNVIMDGRDIGNTVFPHAQVKLFMTADPLVRAKRRYKEIKPKFPKITLEEVIENLKHRDHLDTTREISPLKQAPDALVLDNTNMSEQEQLDFALRIIADAVQAKTQ